MLSGGMVQRQAIGVLSCDWRSFFDLFVAALAAAVELFHWLLTGEPHRWIEGFVSSSTAAESCIR